MNQEFLQLLSRIDERTQNIEKRQIEELRERKDLGDRVGALENWRNFILGGIAVIVFCLASGIQYLENKIHGH